MLNSRRILLFVPIVILGLMIPFFVYLRVNAQGPDGFETYVGPNGRYVFQYPEDWFVSNEIGVIIISNLETSFIVAGEMEEDEVTILFVPPEELDAVMGIDAVGSPTIVMESYIDSTSGGNINTYSEPEGIIIGETVGVRVFVSDFEVEGWVYMIDAGNDTVMMVLAITALDEFDEHEDIVGEILDTIRFGQVGDAGMTMVGSPTLPIDIAQPTLSDFSLTATAFVEMFVSSSTPSLTGGQLPEVGAFEDQPTASTDVMQASPVVVITLVVDDRDRPDFEATIVALESTIAALEANETTTNADGCEVYVVREGDNLLSIATRFDVSVEALSTLNGLGENPNLDIDQEIVIPSEVCPPEAVIPTATPSSRDDRTPRPTAHSLSEIEIVQIDGAGDIMTESVEIGNVGGLIDMTGWTLEDEDGHVYEFPVTRLFPNGSIQVLSGVGQDSPIELYWNESESIWQDGEIATLLDADGNVAATFIVGEE